MTDSLYWQCKLALVYAVKLSNGWSQCLQSVDNSNNNNVSNTTESELIHCCIHRSWTTTVNVSMAVTDWRQCFLTTIAYVALSFVFVASPFAPRKRTVALLSESSDCVKAEIFLLRFSIHVGILWPHLAEPIIRLTISVEFVIYT